MKIVVVGDGKVGFAIAEQLSKEGHDITIIDNKDHALQKSIETLDVIAIKGNGASLATQMKAGVDEADLLIAATSMDEINMVCCQLGKKLGVKNAIARIRNPEYNDQLALMKEELGLSKVVNPELAAAIEISRLVSLPSAINIGSFAEGRVLLVEIKIQPDSPLVGKPLCEIGNKNRPNVLICAVMRKSEAYIPNGDFVLQAGDHIFISGDNKNIVAFIRSQGRHERKVHSAMLVGGSLIAHHLSNMLIEHGISVKIIEINEAKCRRLCDEIPKALVIQGDGTDQELLESEGIAQTGAFIALTDMDEENLIMSMYAAYKSVPKVIAKINRLGYSEVIKNAGINTVISPKNIAASQIVRYVRNMHKSRSSRIRALYRIMGEAAEVLEFKASADTKAKLVKLAEISLRKNVIIAAIVRGDRLIIPHGDDFIQTDDKVIVVTTLQHLDDLNDIFPE